MNDIPNIPLTEEDYDRFDEQLPVLAEQATREAYEQALQSGFPVTILVGTSKIQVTANGAIKELKQLPEAQRLVTQRYFEIE